VSFRDEWLRAFFVEDTRSRHIPSDVEGRLFRKLQMVDDATTDQDLRAPPSNHFEKLRGNLAGFHSIRVNSQWRLVFRWDGSRGEGHWRSPTVLASPFPSTQLLQSDNSTS
jgi:proteic killer suppression protein